MLLLLQNLYAQNFQCQYLSPTPFENYIVDYNKQLEKIAINKPMAPLADKTLSKLLTAKSPIIMNWLATRKLSQAPVEKIAQQWRLYYTRHFILNNFPSKNLKINKVTEGLVDGLLPEHISLKKYKNLFKEAKKLSLKTIEQWGVDKKTKQNIQQRVAKIQLFWPVPFNKAKEKSALDVMEWSVHYDPISNQVKMGAQVLKYPNDATVVAVFAHEIGHSIDPCRWGAFMTTKNPFEKLYSCLRSPNAAGAKPRDNKQLEKLKKLGQISNDKYTMMKISPYCNKSFYPPKGFQKEQLNETFADWFSAETIAESKYLQVGLRSDLCEDKSITAHSSYIAYIDRLKKVYFAQPKIANALKVKSTANYCKL